MVALAGLKASADAWVPGVVARSNCGDPISSSPDRGTYRPPLIVSDRFVASENLRSSSLLTDRRRTRADLVDALEGVRLASLPSALGLRPDS